MNILLLSSSTRNFPLDFQAVLTNAGFKATRLDSLPAFIASPLRLQPFFCVLEIGNSEDIDRALIAFEWAETVQPAAPARFLLLVGSKHISMRDRAGRFRGVEIAQLPLPSRNLLFKVELQLKLLAADTRPRPAGSGFSAQERASDRGRVMVLKGPSPRDGAWNQAQSPQGKVRWRWVTARPAENADIMALEWTVDSATAPEFVEDEKAWHVHEAGGVQCEQGGVEIFRWPPREGVATKIFLGDRPDTATAYFSSEREATTEKTLAADEHAPVDDSRSPSSTPTDVKAPERKSGADEGEDEGQGFAPLEKITRVRTRAEKEAPEGAGEKARPAALEPAAEERPEREAVGAPGENAAPGEKTPANKQAWAEESSPPRRGEKSSATLPAQKKNLSAPGEIPVSSLGRSKSTENWTFTESLIPTKQIIPPSPVNVALSPNPPSPATKNSLPAGETSPRPGSLPSEKSAHTEGEAGPAGSGVRVEEEAAKRARPVSLAENSAAQEEARPASVREGSGGMNASLPRGDLSSLPEKNEKAPGPETAKPEEETSQAPNDPHTPRTTTKIAPLPKSAELAETTTIAGEARAERGRIVLPDSPAPTERVTTVTDRKPSAEPDSPGHFLKMRHFLIMTLAELNDDNSSWHPSGPYRIYLSARHRYYGLQGVENFFPLWVYEGELAPEFLERESAWKFYDRLPERHESLETVPPSLALQLRAMAGEKMGEEKEIKTGAKTPNPQTAEEPKNVLVELNVVATPRKENILRRLWRKVRGDEG